MKTSSLDGEKIFLKAIKLIKGNCPEEKCEWCEGK